MPALQAATTVEQLAALDLFVHLRMREAGFAAANNLKTDEFDGGPRVKPLPKLLQRRFLAALGIGAVLGLCAFAVRNVLSDNAAWSEVKARVVRRGQLSAGLANQRLAGAAACSRCTA